MRALFDTLFPPRVVRNLKLEAQGFTLRPPQRGDYPAWVAARIASRAHLTPWEPSWAKDELEPAHFRARVRQAERDAARDETYSFLIISNEGGALLGGITLGNIRRRAAQSGTLGYWMHAQHAGRGIMTEAVRTLCAFGFSTLLLERIEAACIPGNKASIRVLEKAGFEVEGVAKSYLQIAGARRDHLLFARLKPPSSPHQELP